jgi:MFS family permease
MIVLSVLLFIVAVAVLVTGILAATGTLPGNSWVGLRIPEVRKSRQMWVTAHKIAGVPWVGAGVAFLGAALVSLKGGWLWIITALLVVGGLFLIGMGAALAASTAARLDHLRAKEAEERRAAAGCCSSGNGSAEADSCGGDCGGDCSGHADTALSTPALDLDAARRAMASRDGK